MRRKKVNILGLLNISSEKEDIVEVKISPLIKAECLCGSEVKVTQSCPTLFNPMDYTVHGILQARTLESVAFPFSKGSSQPRDWTQDSCVTADSLPAGQTREAPIYVV